MIKSINQPNKNAGAIVNYIVLWFLCGLIKTSVSTYIYITSLWLLLLFCSTMIWVLQLSLNIDNTGWYQECERPRQNHLIKSLGCSSPENAWLIILTLTYTPPSRGQLLRYNCEGRESQGKVVRIRSPALTHFHSVKVSFNQSLFYVEWWLGEDSAAVRVNCGVGQSPSALHTMAKEN